MIHLWHLLDIFSLGLVFFYHKIVQKITSHAVLKCYANPLGPLHTLQPHSPDNRALARECKDVKIDRVYIGSCTGGKTEDFLAAAKVFLASVRWMCFIDIRDRPQLKTIYTLLLHLDY